MNYRRLLAGMLAGFVLLLIALTHRVSAKTIPVRVDRWLAIEQLSGRVTYGRNQTQRPAQKGDRLQAVGDSLRTNQNSTATLLVDTGIGAVQLAENTQLRVQSLGLAPDNGRITRLQVTQGQVRLTLRRFTHRGSRLEIETPASLSGVRGTDFGITVQPNGTTGLATLTGTVVTEAQETSVTVPGGFQTLIQLGEPPAPPVPLRNDTRLNYRLNRMIDAGVRQIQLEGQVDPVNTVTIDDQPIPLDRTGRFTLAVYPTTRWRVRVTVSTPLGKQESYELALE